VIRGGYDAYDAPDSHVIELYGEFAAILELTCRGLERKKPTALAVGCRFKWLREQHLDTVFEIYTSPALCRKDELC